MKRASLEQLAPCFAEMATLPNSYSYGPSNIFNMDETGEAMGDTQSLRSTEPPQITRENWKDWQPRGRQLRPGKLKRQGVSE